MFDILESEYTSELLLAFDFEGQEEQAKDILGQMAELGYDSHNAILNLGSVLIFALFWLIQVIFCGLLKIWTKLTRRGFRMLRNLKHRLFFTEILSLMIEAYLEFIISGWLNSQVTLDTTNGEIVSKYVGYISLFITLVVMPGAFLQMMRHPKIDFLRKKFTRKWGGFYEGVRTRYKVYSFFYFIFMMRRVLFVTVAFTTDTIIYQILFLNFLNLSILMYNGYYAPLVSRLANRIELFNEVCIHLASLHLIFFTDWLPDSDTQYMMGWSMIVFICGCMFVNFALVFYSAGRSMKLLFIKYYNRTGYQLKKLKLKYLP